MKRLIAVAAVVLLPLSACGSPDSSAAPARDTTPSSAVAPECSDVWQEGKTLPLDYAGCLSEAAVLGWDKEFSCAKMFVMEDEKSGEDEWLAEPGESVQKYTDESYAAIAGRKC